MPAAPRRLMRSAAAGALAISASGVLYAGTAAPARAAGYNGYCTSSTGVTVVVDFRSLGGGVAVRCAPVRSGATGLDALQAAGVPVTMAARQPGFVCRLYGKPASDPCVNASPTTAYWSYWHAPNGGAWSYSSEGAASHHVIPGGFEGWAFSTGSKVAPGVAPVRPAPKPKPTATHTTTRPPAPPRHTTTTAPPRHTTTTAPPSTTAARHDPAPSAHSSTAHRSRPSSTAPATAHTSHTTSSSRAAKKSRRASGTSTSASAAGSASSGSTSGGAVAAGGARLADSDRLINESDKSSSINATTAVGGGVLAVLAIGGAAVAIIRRRNLG
ncbi:hypothetical protein [Flexivirga oryzae]|uniref:Gram-positive cocci surface proteins LPxTG domain-containing protein n=1 Tax=Flexivirga oryzae TaxID=1794944 RepID=A0A839NAY6_9MICO|nr:hypothetical protein [Flexivirga oryzae]MBB2893144.1 hypothetical protein [Flexivirga oryzae]